MVLKREQFLQRAADAEASAKRVSNPVYRDSYLELAKAFRDIADLLTENQLASDEQIKTLVERMIRKATSP